MGGASSQGREYAAIHGLLAIHADTNLGVAFISLPGDFQAIPIPTRVDKAEEQNLLVEDTWHAVSSKETLAQMSVLDGSPVVDEKGKPVGLFIAQKVVSFPQLFEAFMKIDAKSLGYWGAESAKIESQVVEGLPELIPAELRAQIEKAASLQGKEKAKAMKELQTLLSMQVDSRNRFTEQKINALQNKLATLTRLASEMKNKDTAEVNTLLPKELTLEIRQIVDDNDPFK